MKETNYIGHSLHSNLFLKRVIGEKVEGRIEVTRRRR